MKVLLPLSTIGAAFALLAGVSVQDTSSQNSKGLTLRGKVESLQVKELSRSAVLIDIKLRVELLNVGAKPVILLKREPFFPGGSLSKKPDFHRDNVLVSDAGWPSNESSPEWDTLRSNLDKPGPPANETHLLMPGESRPMETSVRFVVPTDPNNYNSSKKKATLATIQQLSPVWLRVVCEVWPWNVEPLNADRNKLKFGRKLQKRWKDTGVLWLDDLYSEPITLDLNEAKP